MKLKQLQEWMSILVEHPRSARAGAHTKAARAIVSPQRVRRGEVVLPNDRMDPFQRVQVYNGGYFARLKEVLESDHPGLVHALGEETWLHVALGYLQRHPSRHPNLNRLNKNLPDYLATRKGLPNRAFHRDLARLEVLMTDAFDAPEFEPLDMTTLKDLTPDQWTALVFQPNPSLQVESFSYPVNAYLQDVFDGSEPGIPPRQKSHLAVYRHDHRVYRLTLSSPMFTVLTALCAGTPFGKALAEVATDPQQVTRWFQTWSADGLFVGAAI
jgi:hypothetical protein